MKVDWSFPSQVAVALLVIGCIAAYPLIRFGSSEIIEAAIVGALLTTLNVLLGYAAVEYSFGKSTATFFKYVLGGMGIRLMAMALILILLIKGFQFHVGALVTSMGIFYVTFLGLEILFIQKKVSIKHHN
ncbi:MAG: hypothetical protein HYR76_07500 [Ignavibacteria bacterium]|nr:hypothetical protein [Ignavibacteria bacterium]MBI3765388.1 hypothetical protein [Ignavibacteriales bacterium]